MYTTFINGWDSRTEHMVRKRMKVKSLAPSMHILKGTVSRDFLLLVLFTNQFPPSPRVFHYI
jgi:hypothetical protein